MCCRLVSVTSDEFFCFCHNANVFVNYCIIYIVYNGLYARKVPAPVCFAVLWAMLLNTQKYKIFGKSIQKSIKKRIFAIIFEYA